MRFRHRYIRLTRTLQWAGLSLGLLIVVLVVVLLIFDLSAYRGQVEWAVSESINRKVKIGGELSLGWTLPPTLVARNVTIANPDWAKRPHFAQADALEVQVSFIGLLFSQELRIDRLVLRGADIALERGPDGAGNWVFASRGEGARKLSGSFRVRNTLLRYDGGERELKWFIEDGIAEIERPLPIVVASQGTANDVPYELSLSIGEVIKPEEASGPAPVRAKLKLGRGQLDIEGTVAEVAQAKGLRLNLRAQGDAAEFYKALSARQWGDIPLINVSAALADDAGGYSIELGRSEIGASSLTGRLRASTGGARQALSGELVFERLDLSPWIALAEKGATGPAGEKLEARALASLPPPLDLALAVSAKELTGAGYAGAELTGKLTLGEKRFALEAVKLRIAEGALEAAASLDLEKPKARLEVSTTARALRLDRLWPAVAEDSHVGELRWNLRAAGETARELRARAQTEIRVKDLKLVRVGADPARTVAVAIESLSAESQGAKPVTLKAAGRIQDTPISAQLTGASLAELWADQAWPFELVAQLPKTSLRAEGSLGAKFKRSGFSLRASARGDTLDRLAALAGARWPAIGPYELDARIAGVGSVYRLESLELRLGESRITGNGSISIEAAKPRVTVTLHSERVRWVDVTPRAQAGDTRLLPDMLFPRAPLPELDLDINVGVDQLVAARWSVESLQYRVTQDGSRLRIAPINATIAGGNFAASVDLDASSPPPSIVLRAALERLDLARLPLRARESIGALEGQAHLALEMSGRGERLREAVAQGEGRFELVARQGRLSAAKLELWAADLVTALINKGLQRDAGTDLNCMVARFEAKNGVARSEALIADTTRMTVAGSALIDLRSEEIEAVLKPAPKALSLVSIAEPVHVKGTLASPRVARTAAGRLRTAAGLLAGLSNPAALLVLFGDVGTGKDDACVAAANKQLADQGADKVSLLDDMRSFVRKIQRPLEAN